MKHYVAKTHLPKNGPLHRYIGTDAETMREARANFKKMIEKDEYIAEITSVTIDKISKYR